MTRVTQNKLIATSISLAVVGLISQQAMADFYQVRQPNGTILLTNTPQKGAVMVQKELPKPVSNTVYNPSPNPVNNPTTLSTTTPSTIGNYPNANSTPNYTPNPNAPTVINYSRNQLENVNRQTLGSFLSKWQSGGNVVIAHFGDSHVQPGWQVAPIRNLLQQARGNGGRGMIFPYSIAKTYSQEDYTSSATGAWRTANSIQQPPKIGVGVSGFVAVTASPFAQVNFNFKDSAPMLGNVRATLYYRAVGGSYQVSMGNGNVSKSANLTSDAGISQASFDLPNTARNLTLSINRQSGGGEFELHGISLTNLSGNGVIYHNLGVGGAAYKALIQQRFFDQQFPQLGADMVILDWGTNDILFTNRVDGAMESTIRQTIRKVRNANPNTAIVLTSPQEPRYHRANVTAAAQLSNLLRRIALEENCLFYDWYTISGGTNAMNAWQSSGFSSKDAIHLNGKGYRVHGEMFAHALLKAVQGGN